MQLNSSDLSGPYHEQQILPRLICINGEPESILTKHINHNFFRFIFEIDSNFLHEVAPIEIELPNRGVQMHGGGPEAGRVGVDGGVGVHAGVGKRGRSVHVAVWLHLLNHVVVFGGNARCRFGFWHYFAQTVDHETEVVGIAALLRLSNIRVLLWGTGCQFLVVWLCFRQKYTSNPPIVRHKVGLGKTLLLNHFAKLHPNNS